jgi:hypothetical protein
LKQASKQGSKERKKERKKETNKQTTILMMTMTKMTTTGNRSSGRRRGK